ncbi:TIGR01777 family oxidoreductase [Carboxylicivirga sediminis]|uniref:TIGR01777 family oxidoreductase n=1 Tax=Carboxylicivirga sediminis TaxID=2006564 RepID=A0A941IWW3_9BACT|nr:TIGR01777 family oxidoreductase [Carboxylicivirga sediminis]MBR8534928.1 TIGR01777 family oxidoreductase [Carboxylicivirga sediminis]
MPQGRIDNKIAISGATGFIGNALSNFLECNGYTVVRLKRQHFKSKKSQLKTLLNGCSVVINLAGAPIAAKKWTPNYKREILNSRINTTNVLVDAIHQMETSPEIFITASAVGIYDSFEVHDEFSTNYANDFLGDVCKQWEAEAYKVQSLTDVRLCIVRLGVVLGNEGGAFPRMLKPFKFGLGARLGDGHQVFPFIHLNDVLSAFWYLIRREASNGIYNLVAPQMLSNLEITEAIKERTRKSVLPAIPEKLLRVMFGEGANALLVGQKVLPKRLEKDGFHFEFPTFEAVLDDLIC